VIDPVRGDSVLVAHQHNDIPAKQISIPEGGSHRPLFKGGERGEKKACSSNNSQHQSPLPDDPGLLISASMSICRM